MSTDIRSEISKKNKYWISKERYLELKHFCLQYPEWKKKVISDLYLRCPATHGSDIQENKAFKLDDILSFDSIEASNIKLLNRIAFLTSPDFKDYILLAVTENYSCQYLILVKDMPCGKDKFYELYRKFFWLLSKEKYS